MARTVRRAAWWALAIGGAMGCSRASAPAPESPEGLQSAAPVGAPAEGGVSGVALPGPARASAPANPLTPAPPGEAVRSVLARLGDQPLLRAQLSALHDHFGPDLGGPFEVQSITLAGGANGVLVSRPDDADPIFLVVDRDRLLWSKKRPVAGITPPVRHLAVAPGPDGGAVVFGWVEALGMIAARMWADDSNPFGDFEVFAPDRCDALSAAYAAGFGWVIVCAGPGGARAARMTEDITMPWGRRGVPLGSASAAGPATVAFDSESSFVLLQRAASARGERVLASRYDGRGMDLWAAPVPVDAVGIAVDARERIVAQSTGNGEVRVEPLRGKAVHGQPCAVSSDGGVRVVH
jgi:hypothetical protein